MLSKWRRFIPWDSGKTTSIPSLEIHVPITPNRYMMNMLHCQVLTLRRFGGAYKDAPLIVTVGENNYDIERLVRGVPWLNRHNVEIRAVPHDLFAQHSIAATAGYRLLYDFRSDVVLILDCDVMVARPFDELIHDVYADQVFAGHIAHGCPLKSSSDWYVVFRRCGLGEPKLEFQHTGWGFIYDDPDRRFCPAYFNYGVLCATRDVCSAVGRELFGMLETVTNFHTNEFRGQIAMAAAIAKAGVRYRALPARYNFANDPDLEAAYTDELPHASLLHLLRNRDGVYKTGIFDSVQSIEEFLNIPGLTAVNAVAQRRIADIFDQLLRDQADVDTGVYAPDGHR